MYLQLLILICSFIPSYLFSTESPLPAGLVFSPIANPTYHYSPLNLNEVKPTINCTSTSLSYAIAISLRDYMLPWVDKIKNNLTKSNYELLKNIIHDFLWKYRYFIVGNTLLGSYVTTTIVLLSDYHFMNEKTRWSQWKCDCSFEELCSIPQQQLTKELLIAINKRHCNEGNPTDFNHPLIIFISDMNNEIYRINRYITIVSLQKRLHLMRIFPTNETKIKKAEQLLTRAHFIKHLFLSWLAEYNVDNT
jgi:hypothetical protein